MSKFSFVKLAAASAVAVLSGVASAASLVTLDPGAANGSLGTLEALDPIFTASGFNGKLDAQLQIFGTTGVANYSETGRIRITDFNGGAPASVTIGANYNVYIDFTLTGAGAWLSPTFYQASTANLTFTLRGDPDATIGNSDDFVLGTGTLAPGIVNATAIVAGGLVSGSSGAAQTGFSGLVSFTPSAGTTGIGGFFRAPSPFNISIGIGNAGGNQLNTVYSVSGTTVTITTPAVAGSADTGTANASFEAARQVPEPSGLALVGLALVAASAVARRARK